MIPTLGRIVLVRSPAFIGEVPAIVVGLSRVNGLINVRAFTNDHEHPMFLQGVQEQTDSSQQWGWRWPPRNAESHADSGNQTPALPAQEPLASV